MVSSLATYSIIDKMPSYFHIYAFRVPYAEGKITNGYA
jgi:hypothetical protein